MSTEAERSRVKNDKPKSELWENAKAIFFALLIFLFVRVLIFQPFTIPSQSMEPGLKPGDYILVTKWDYGFSRYSIPFAPPLFKGRILERQPKRGEVIVFRVPTDRNRDYIKRLVGLPGDRVSVKEGMVFVNGTPLARAPAGASDTSDPFAKAAEAYRETSADGRTYTTYDTGYQMADDFEEVIVPEGRYFFMGDNRDNSLDSRFPTARGGVGFVRDEHLIGRARFIMLSWDGASIFKPWTWFTRAVPDRFFQGIE